METKIHTALFEPLKKVKLDLNNRIVMAPMTRSRAINSLPNDLMATYYGQRSSAGLIITEGTSPLTQRAGILPHTRRLQQKSEEGLGKNSRCSSREQQLHFYAADAYRKSYPPGQFAGESESAGTF